MALKIEKCEIIETSHSMVSSLVSRLEEGTALVYVMEGGKNRVKGSTGVAGEKFAGVANSRHVTPSEINSANWYLCITYYNTFSFYFFQM